MKRQEEIQRLIAQGVVSCLVLYNRMPRYALRLLRLCISHCFGTFLQVCVVISEVVLVASYMLLQGSSCLSHYSLLRAPEAILSQLRRGFIASFHSTEDCCHLGYDSL
jgi:hypothetical protein